jgi:hypothetical protein
MSDSRFEPKAPFSDEEIGRIEKRLGRELPSDYRDFVKQYGGAFVSGLVDGSGSLPILVFFNFSRILEELETHTALRKQGALPFADCEFGNLWVLAKDNSVHFLVTYGGKSTQEKVSDSFQDFIDRIVVADE